MGFNIKRFGTRIAGASSRYKALSSVALNASAATRTVTCNVTDVSEVVLLLSLTRTAATDLQVTPSVSLDGGTTYGQLTSVAISGGTGTVTDYVDSKAVSGNTTMVVRYNVRGADYFKAVVSGTSGGANDTVDVYVSGVP